MQILLVDIETAPNRAYVWGLWGQNIALNQIEEPGYTLCWAAKWKGNDEVMFSSIHRDGKAHMLQSIHQLLDMADVVVHYNGTKFDIPILNQEFLSEGYAPPSPVLQVDLLKTVRKQFRLPSNKLDYVARHLNLVGKEKHKGMGLWRDCMAGDADAWKIMESYNKQDVKLLENVYDRLLPWIPNHPNHALFNDTGVHSCPNCGGTHLHRRGLHYTKTLTYQRYQCQGCGTWSRERLTNLDKEKRKTVLVGA